MNNKTIGVTAVIAGLTTAEIITRFVGTEDIVLFSLSVVVSMFAWGAAYVRIFR